MQLREVRVEQQLRRVDSYRRLSFAFITEHPVRIHHTPELRTYTKRTERLVITIQAPYVHVQALSGSRATNMYFYKRHLLLKRQKFPVVCRAFCFYRAAWNAVAV